jgi:hypothetical protein
VNAWQSWAVLIVGAVVLWQVIWHWPGEEMSERETRRHSPDGSGPLASGSRSLTSHGREVGVGQSRRPYGVGPSALVDADDWFRDDAA